MCFVPRIWHSTLLITSKWVHSRRPPVEAAHLLGFYEVNCQSTSIPVGNRCMASRACSHWRKPFKLLMMHMMSDPPEEMRSTEEKKASGFGN